MRRNNRKDNKDKEFEENVISIDRISRVVKGGRRFRFRALVAVGDGKNRVGVGVAKAGEVTSAISKAVDVAKKNMITIPIVNETIPHEVKAKKSGAKIMIMPASEGTGVVAGGAVRSVLEVTGVNNVLSKIHGSSNKINNAYATIKALSDLEKIDKEEK